MKQVNVRFPSDDVDAMDREVKENMYFEDRSDLVRFAVRQQLQRELDA